MFLLKSRRKKSWFKGKNALETQEEIMAKVIDIVKVVKVLLENSVQGFLPLSQLDLHSSRKPHLTKVKPLELKWCNTIERAVI